MADKQISQLVAATTINNDDLFVMQQGGTAKKLSGQKLADFVYQSAADQIERVDEAVEQAEAAVEQAEAAVEYLEEQKNEIAQAVAAMAELGTDTTLSTPGMAADAAATGRVKDIALARFEQAEITGVPIANFEDGADDVPVKKLVVDIAPVQSGSGDPSPDNVRPITGWTGANISVTSKNLFGGEYFANTLVSAINRSQSCYKGTDSTGNYVRLVAGEYISRKTFSGSLKFKENTRYTIVVKAQKNSTNNSTNICVVYTDGTVNDIRLNNGTAITANTIYTEYYYTAANKTIKSIQTFWASGTATIYYDNFGLFEGLISSNDFEEYKGNVHLIEFPSEAGTVYGGTLDATNGVLTVDKAIVDLSTLSWDATGSTGHLVSTQGIKTLVKFPASDYVTPNAISDTYAVVPNDKSQKSANDLSISLTGYLFIYFEDNTSFTVSGNLVYELATPITYQLTPPVVRTLLALNNIWADTGNINDLIYRKMPIPAEELENTIESMITGVEHTMEATQNYTEGDLVIAAHKLYHIDSNIASGETLVPGTNCHITTIADELASLKTSVNNLDLALGSLGSLATLNYQVVT